MVDDHKRRFLAMLHWLGRKYPINGEPRALPEGENLRDYYQALRDIPIGDLEQGAKWHYAHDEFYPHQPAKLRKAVVEWRTTQPRRTTATSGVTMVDTDDQDRELATKSLEYVLGKIDRGESPEYSVDDLVRRVAV